MADTEINQNQQCIKQSKILVVDDEELIRRMCRSVFEAEGFEVIEASSGAEALSVLEKKKIPLMLVDVVMPGMSGLELLKQVKERYRDTDVVIMTGYSTVEYAVESLKVGASDFLTKPFESISILKQSVTKVFEKQALSKLNETLTEDLTRKNDTLAWLFSVTSRIGEIRDHNQLVKYVCQKLMEAVPCSVLGLFVVTEKQEKHLHMISQGKVSDQDRWINEFLARVSRLSGDNSSDSEVEVFVQVLEEKKIAVWGVDEINIKLEKVGSVTGLICLVSPEGYHYNDEEKNLVYSVGAQFEVAYERLRLKFMEERARIGGIIDVLGDGVIVMDERCQPSLANTAALEIFGHKSLDELPDDARLGVIFRRIRDGKQEIRRFNICFLKPKRFNLAVISAPIGLVGEKLAGYVISMSNVTSLKNEGRRRLEFVSVIANKLPSVTNEAIKLLQLGTDVTRPKLENQLRKIRRQCWRLLSFSQMEAGPLRLDRLRIWIPKLLEGVLEQIDYDNLKSLVFDVDVRGEIPELYADEDLLKILFTALLENSMRVSPEGGSVSITISDDLDMIIVKVADEGPGVTSLQADIIFDVSKQLMEFENMNVEEIGVGLPMAKHIVEAHGGKIWLFRDNEQGRSGIGFSLRKWF